MPRIAPVTAADTPGASASLLAAVQAKLGRVPNLVSTLGHSPAALRGYLALAEALAGGSLTGREREMLALAVGEANGCDYCVAAHVGLGQAAGLGAAEVRAARLGHASAPREHALLQLAKAVLRERGRIDDAALASARRAGLGDGELLEVVALVALNVLTNTVNHVAQTELDFPAAPPLDGAA